MGETRREPKGRQVRATGVEARPHILRTFGFRANSAIRLSLFFFAPVSLKIAGAGDVRVANSNMKGRCEKMGRVGVGRKLGP